MNKIIEKSFNDFESAKVFLNQLSIEDNNYYKLNINLFYQNFKEVIFIEGFIHSEKIKEVFFIFSTYDMPRSSIVLKDCLFGNLKIDNRFRNLCFVNSKSIENTKILITQTNLTNNIDNNKLRISIENTESDPDLSLELDSEYFMYLSKFVNIKNSNFNKIGQIFTDSPGVQFNKCTFSQQVSLNPINSLIFYDCEFNGNLNLENSDKESCDKWVCFTNGKISSNIFNIKDINVDFSEIDFVGSSLYVIKGREKKFDDFDLINIPNKLNFKFCKNLKIFLSSNNLLSINSLSIENPKKNDNIYNKIDCLSGLNKIELNDCEITDFSLRGEITEKAIFNKVTFKNPPEIGDIKFKNCNVEFRDVKFKDNSSPQAIAGFRALNKACRDANYHHGEIFFHGLELETRFNMLVERSYLFKYLFKCFLKIKSFIENSFLKNSKPVSSNNEVEKKNNLPNANNNIKVISQDASKIYKKIYIKVINSTKDLLSTVSKKILSFLKKIFQLIANFIKHFLYFLISFFFISKDGIERFLLSFHKLFSDFGRSLLLPLCWLFIFAILVWWSNSIQIKSLIFNFSPNTITNKILDKNKPISAKSFNQDLINDEDELQKINKKIIFKNAIGPLQLALPKDFIEEDEIKSYHDIKNLFIDSLNFIHAIISYAIWFVWFFMIRARFKL